MTYTSMPYVLAAVADRHGLTLIEDAAQAHGATYRGRPVGAPGMMSGAGLNGSKTLSALGEGGLYPLLVMPEERGPDPDDVPAEALRDALAEAVHAEGLGIMRWQPQPQPQPVPAQGQHRKGPVHRCALLTAVLALFACGNTAVDVAMNTQGVLVERAYARPVLGGFHAMFSLGGIVGAGVGGLVASAGVGTGPHFAVTAVVLCAVAAWAATAQAPEPRRAERAARDAGPLLALPGPGLWIPGLVAFCALMGEGVVNDWGAVYLHEATGASAGLAGTGFAVFSAGMVVGRLSADRVRSRVGTTRCTLGCAAVAGVGALIPVASPTVHAGFLGYGLLGLGMAAVIPVVFSHAADRNPERPGPSIAAVSAVGYVGFLAGPPLIGALTESTTLRTAMLVLPTLMATMAVLSTRLRGR
ncbi:MFS transporter [Streptomyces sp. MNP-20]|uniref:MFS transporter n=1 Tax=Streptomyces sp. MNP-20 TaxID=2721165 RepID=UPI001554D806|nr:MFS transporter [Streptomyces sp. MNP-20]